MTSEAKSEFKCNVIEESLKARHPLGQKKSFALIFQVPDEGPYHPCRDSLLLDVRESLGV